MNACKRHLSAIFFLRLIVFLPARRHTHHLHERLGNTRLFTVGIGSAPNSYFMRKAAQFGRGTFTYIGAVTEVREKMNALFRKLESPLAGDLKVQWPGNTDVEAYPSRLPDLYHGEPVRPWPWADTWPVARLQWREDVDLYVLAGINGASLPFGPGMETQNDDQPILIAGHRDTHFAFLARIRPGDALTVIDMQGKRAVSRVSGREIVDSREEELMAGANTRGLILVTCYPYDALRAGGPLRFVVTAARQVSVKNNSL